MRGIITQRETIKPARKKDILKLWNHKKLNTFNLFIYLTPTGPNLCEMSCWVNRLTCIYRFNSPGIEFLEILCGSQQIQPMYMTKLDDQKWQNWTVWDSVSRIELYTCEDKLWGMHFWHFSHCWQWRDRCFLNRLPVIMLVVWHSERHLKNGFIENIK